MSTVLANPRELLAARLDDPAVVENLNRLLDQLPLLAFGAEAVSELIRRGDSITESISQEVSELRQLKVWDEAPRLVESIPQLYRAGTGLAEAANKPAFQNLLNSGLIEELGKPETISLIKRLFGKLELIVFAVESVDDLIRRSDTIIDSTRQSLIDATKLLPDAVTAEKLMGLAGRIPGLFEVAMKLLDTGIVEKLEHVSTAAVQIVDSGLLDSAKVKTLADMGGTMVETLDQTKKKAARNDIPKIGVLGLLGALRDPDIQATLAFALDFGKRYGAKMRATPPAGPSS
jgi:uncharacterized protein YjgD (DUF1641 family)